MTVRSYIVACMCVLCGAMSCRNHVDPAFVEYLKAEQGLRDRLNNSPALDDSLSVLEERFGIDREVELEFLKDHPEEWVVLLRTLRNEK